MILSVSRRTDIPAFYSEWFLERIKEGFLYVRNPMNPNQVSKINLDNDMVDCIVFWTKNPEAMLDKLDKINDYMFYFQYTLNPYNKIIEKNLPDLEHRLNTFIKLSETIGRDRVIWRYDPIFLTNDIDIEFHISKFEYISKILSKYTNVVMISILDDYRKIKKNMQSIDYRIISEDELSFLTKKFKEIAIDNGLDIYSCAEEVDLSKYGIEPGKCIDDKLISRLLNQAIEVKKDKNQREVCGCVESVEIGAYNTCLNNCIYCYANYNYSIVKDNYKNHDINSPMLIGKIEDKDKITERKIKRFRNINRQITLFDGNIL